MRRKKLRKSLSRSNFERGDERKRYVSGRRGKEKSWCESQFLTESRGRNDPEAKVRDDRGGGEWAYAQGSRSRLLSAPGRITAVVVCWWCYSV